jgi:hypothetical protein
MLAQGGGIVTRDCDMVSIIGCTFERCTAEKYDGFGGGGVVMIRCDLACAFTTAHSWDTVVASPCKMRQASITSCIFEGCGGPVRGGAVSALNAELMIDGTSFRHCWAYDGGAIRFGDMVLNADREGLR